MVQRAVVMVIVCHVALVIILFGEVTRNDVQKHLAVVPFLVVVIGGGMKHVPEEMRALLVGVPPSSGPLRFVILFIFPPRAEVATVTYRTSGHVMYPYGNNDFVILKTVCDVL